jgi:hypothetical protein
MYTFAIVVIEPKAIGDSPMDAQAAKALLENSKTRARALFAGPTKSKPQVLALRAETFVAILRAEPGLIRYERLAGSLDYSPFYGETPNDWRIEITNEPMQSAGFRAKVIGPFGSYLEASARDARQ